MFTKDDGSDISTLQKSLIFYPSIIQTIEFNVEEVCNELHSLNCHKACGPDLLPSCLLKLGAEYCSITNTFISVINFFWEASTGLGQCKYCTCPQEG